MSRTLEDRFWEKVEVRGKDDCWKWKGSRAREEYGNIWGGKRLEKAHRVSYKINIGEIPKGMCVCHTCSNPYCVNPNHLWLGTQLDNIRYRGERGRNAIVKGKYNGRSKLTREIVKRIRKLHSKNGVSITEIAKMFKVAPNTIHYVVKNITWKD